MKWVACFLRVVWCLLSVIVTCVVVAEVVTSGRHVSSHLVSFLSLATLVVDFPVGILVVPISSISNTDFFIWISEEWAGLLEALFYLLVYLVLGWLQWFYLWNVCVRFLSDEPSSTGRDPR